MLQFFSWYITITLLGLLTFPLAYRLLPALPDRGYALSRTLGLLILRSIVDRRLQQGRPQARADPKSGLKEPADTARET